MTKKKKHRVKRKGKVIKFRENDPADKPVPDPGLRQSPAARRTVFLWKAKGVAKFGLLLLVRLGLLKPDLAILLPIIFDLIVKESAPQAKSEAAVLMALKLAPYFRGIPQSALRAESLNFLRDKEL